MTAFKKTHTKRKPFKENQNRNRSFDQALCFILLLMFISDLNLSSSAKWLRTSLDIVCCCSIYSKSLSKKSNKTG